MKDRIAPGVYVGLLMGALLGLFALVWIYTAKERIRFLPMASSSWQAHAQMIHRCDVGDVAIFGSSRATAAFVPKLIGHNTVNLGLFGSTPVEGYFEARRVYACARYPKIAILSFSPEDFDRSTWFWPQSARFGLISGDDLRDLAENARITHDDLIYHSSFGSQPPPAMKNFLYATHFPPYDFASLLASRLGGSRKRENIRLINETLATRGQHLIWQNTSVCGEHPDIPRDFSANVSEFSPRPLTVFYFKRLLELLKEKGVNVIFVAAPMSQIELQYYSRNYLNEYINFLTSYEGRQPGFQAVGSYTPTQNLCDFADFLHLNEAGAETFSRRVAPMISAALAH